MGERAGHGAGGEEGEDVVVGAGPDGVVDHLTRHQGEGAVVLQRQHAEQGLTVQAELLHRPEVDREHARH